MFIWYFQINTHSPFDFPIEQSISWPDFLWMIGTIYRLVEKYGLKGLIRAVIEPIARGAGEEELIQSQTYPVLSQRE